jgi:FtsP/CotA-like multicopper oxidase with cupredoxin domain
MKRRDFIKLGMTGLAAITVGSVRIPGLFRTEAFAAASTIDLTMEAAMVEMVDGTQVFHWLFGSAGTGPSFPGPVLTVTAGDDITINVTNLLLEPHAFHILGTRILTPPISPGQTRTITFKAPPAGTYLYIDPLNDPVNRVLGLHGALIVRQASGNTPYSAPTPAVQQLFNDLGTTAHFPKHASYTPPKLPGWQLDNYKIWVQHQVDPAFNAQAQADYEAGRAATVNAAQLKASFLPRYFTMNGKSGGFAANDHATHLHGRIGQPLLVRILNPGLFTHSNHLHANHFYVTAVNNVVRNNVFFLDTLAINPLDRVDWLVPFLRPPDIAGNTATPLRDLIPNELALTISGPGGSPGVPQSPLGYAMHCHMEPSQTAAGGNYPQGALTHVSFLGDIDGVDFPNVV